MMTPSNVPEPEGKRGSPDPTDIGFSIQDRIRQLVTEQDYAVLCTQGHSQPYGSLVAFAASDDLSTLVFSTPVTTRKYRLLTECDHVAMLIDSRSVCPDEMMDIEAVTGTGHAEIVKTGPEFDRWAGLLISRHPHLAAFVNAESSALVRVEVIRYFYVRRFQEVRQWVPRNDS